MQVRLFNRTEGYISPVEYFTVECRDFFERRGLNFAPNGSKVKELISELNKLVSEINSGKYSK